MATALRPPQISSHGIHQRYQYTASFDGAHRRGVRATRRRASQLAARCDRRATRKPEDLTPLSTNLVPTQLAPPTSSRPPPPTTRTATIAANGPAYQPTYYENLVARWEPFNLPWLDHGTLAPAQMHLEYHPTERGVLAWVFGRELAGLLAVGFAGRVLAFHQGCLVVELCLLHQKCLAADADDNDATNAQPWENVIVDWQERVSHLMTADTLTFVLVPVLGVHPARLRNGGWKEEVDKYLAGGIDERVEVRRVVGMHPSFARAICPRPSNVVVPVASTQDEDDGGFEGDDEMEN